MTSPSRVLGCLSVVCVGGFGLPPSAWAEAAALASLESTEELRSTEESSEAGEPSRIVGGVVSKNCHWPAAGYVWTGAGQCTVSLVHPEIIITAAHCSRGLRSVAFTNNKRQVQSKVTPLHPVEYCKNHRSWVSEQSSLGKHIDFAFCKLKKPVTDVQITPILMGCEAEVLKNNPSIVAVGFGKTSASNQASLGTKREVVTQIAKFQPNGEITIGRNGKGSCNGDSGGPLYVKLPEDKYGKDAGWRVFGVTSWGDTRCPGPAHYGRMDKFVEFIEKTSKVDITPCTDAKGTWKPGPECKGAPLNPSAASGDWSSGCKAGPVGSYISSCGDPYRPDGGAAPKVAISTPSEGESFEAEKVVKVVVDASDDGEVRKVVLSVNGKEQEADESAPYVWDLEDLKPGKHKLVAKAEDNEGNTSESKPVNFEVKEAGEKSSGGGETSTEEPGDDDTSSSSETSSSSSGGTANSDQDDDQEEDSDSDDTNKPGDEDSSEEEDTDSDKGNKGTFTRERRGCRSSVGEAPGPWSLGLLVGLGLWWRRRG